MCWFCGDSGLTREHAIPQWLAKVVASMEPSDPPPEFHLRYLAGGVGPDVDRSYGVALPSIVVNCLCARCNSGWLAALEGIVKPILTPLVQGRATQLSLGDQLTVATWASKTVMMLEAHDSRAMVSTLADRRLLRDELRPPAHHRCRLASRASYGSGLAYLIRVGAAEPTFDVANVFCATLVLGFLIIQVWGGPGDQHWQPYSVVGAHGGHSVSINPPVPPLARWPPPEPVADEDLAEFAEAPFLRAEETPELAAWRQRGLDSI